MSSKSRPVKVNILDKEYLVACPEEEMEALNASARYLDKKMKDIRDSGKVVGADRIAVMAALNMAHEIIDGTIGDVNNPNSINSRIRALNERIQISLSDE